MMERLSHCPNFLPASGNVPTGTNPNDSCRATDGTFIPQMHATMLWQLLALQREINSVRSFVPTL